MNTSNLIFLSLQQTLQQRWSQSNHRLGSCHGALENALKDRVCLDNIELRAIQDLGSRFKQPRLEQFDRGCDTEKEGELNAALPGTVV